MSGLTVITFYSGTILVLLLVVGIIFSRLYKKSSKEISFVRTGFGGEKVILNGGALVLPVLHDIIPVNMNTLRLEVLRANEQALITRDRMRVDVTAEFYVRVKPEKNSIANAAQTLGMKTINPDELKSLVEGKFVDALRAVAAEMAMEELHEQRVDFVQKVQQVVSEDLLKNGLELESVSLTGLDQTSKTFFNPDNAFDAEGLTKLTQAIEERRKKRNDIEQDTQVAIANKNLEAEKQQLEITRESEYARLQQEREVAVRRAAQTTEIAKDKADKAKEAEQADIASKQQVELTKISAEQAIEENRIVKERQVKEREIEKMRAVETASIEQKKTVELAEQERAVAVAEKSREQSEAQAEADKARALAVREEEKVITAKETEIAERAKAVELVEAAKLAERDAIKVKVAAETEKQAAQDQAEAVRIEATAAAEKQRIEAQASADAVIAGAEAAYRKYVVDAKGSRAINEARNTLSAEQIAMEVKLALINSLPEIIEQSVKPLEQIEGIKIIQVEGLGGNTGGGNGTQQTVPGQGNLADQVVNSALRFRSQAPLIDSLVSDIGLSTGDINGIASALSGQIGVDTKTLSGQTGVDTQTLSRQTEADTQTLSGQTGVDTQNLSGQTGVDTQTLPGEAGVETKTDDPPSSGA